LILKLKSISKTEYYLNATLKTN